MPTFNKYQVRSPHYHWRQISRNIFTFNTFVMARYQQVIKHIPKRFRQRILDIGCGDGVLLWLIEQQKSAKLYGVDLDQASLDQAVIKVKAKFICASATKLPFRSNFFDIVLATEIIEHLSRPKLMLAEVQRVLKPRGRVIISTPIKSNGGLTDKLHVREFSSRELRQICHRYFSRITIITSHPEWLKKIYTLSLGKIGCYHLDLGRWLINLLVLLTSWNPFISLPGRPTQQLAVCRK